MRSTLKAVIPEPIKKIIRLIRKSFTTKYGGELSHWKHAFKLDHGLFKNSHYERTMLAIAGEPTDDFLKGKIVADFGSGPRGSLVWAGSALLRIGIDVLADRYAEEFTDNIISHGMIYLKSTEKVIPLPSDFVDIMFSVNAMDHVENFSIMCNEIVRVLKPGGEFIGSFNLEEPPTLQEPQQLNEKIIRHGLLSKLEVQSYRITEGPKETWRPGQKGILWIRATKPS